jgi:head-tail adaptor
MRAGKLDRRVRIERATTSQNDFGTPVPTWALLTEVSANIDAGAGSEQRLAMETTADQRRTFKIRWMAGLAVTDRIVYRDYEGGPQRAWDILDIAEIGRREGLLVTAIARQDKALA